MSGHPANVCLIAQQNFRTVDYYSCKYSVQASLGGGSIQSCRTGLSPSSGNLAQLMLGGQEVHPHLRGSLLWQTGRPHPQGLQLERLPTSIPGNCHGDSLPPPKKKKQERVKD